MAKKPVAKTVEAISDDVVETNVPIIEESIEETASESTQPEGETSQPQGGQYWDFESHSFKQI